MNICFACSEYPPGPHGGIGTLVQLMARGLVAQGHPVRVIGICPAAYPAPDYEVDRGVQVWRMRGSSFRPGWLLDRYRMFRTLASWVRKGFVDLIEVPDHGGIAAAWPRLPVPVIFRLSGSASYFAAEMGERPGRYFYLERASLRRSEFLCSESRYVAARTREVFGHLQPRRVSGRTRDRSANAKPGRLCRNSGGEEGGHFADPELAPYS